MSTDDTVVAPEVFRTGGYDQAQMRDALRLLAEVSGLTNPLADRVFVDVGANIGTSSIPAVRTYGASSALAFEPAPDVYRLLRANIAANGLDQRIRAVNAAITDEPGTVEIEISTSNWGDNRVLVGSTSGDRLHALTVPATTLDTALADIRLADIGLVWIDTQGHEARVLAGGRAVMDSGSPVLIEYWPFGLELAGGCSALHEILSSNYQEVIDVRASSEAGYAVRIRAADVESLEATYRDGQYTDLLLLK